MMNDKTIQSFPVLGLFYDPQQLKLVEGSLQEVTTTWDELQSYARLTPLTVVASIKAL